MEEGSAVVLVLTSGYRKKTLSRNPANGRIMIDFRATGTPK